MAHIVLPPQLLHPVLKVRPEPHPGPVPWVATRLDEGGEPVAFDNNGAEVLGEDLGIELFLIAQGEEVAVGLGVEKEGVEVGDKGGEGGR
jgi:hypothetical protein